MRRTKQRVPEQAAFSPTGPSFFLLFSLPPSLFPLLSFSLSLRLASPWPRPFNCLRPTPHLFLFLHLCHHHRYHHQPPSPPSSRFYEHGNLPLLGGSSLSCRASYTCAQVRLARTHACMHTRARPGILRSTSSTCLYLDAELFSRTKVAPVRPRRISGIREREASRSGNSAGE